MNIHLYQMLESSAEADKRKSLLSLELLGNKAVGIGDHSTDDLYNNAEAALAKLESAESRLEILNKYYGQDQETKNDCCN
jgi:hypothetical protein